MTNKDIAQQLGISPAALSLIVNHKPGVSDATRSAVLGKLKEMNLEHIIKKAPVTAAGSNLCFIVYKKNGEILDAHPFFLLLVEEIESRARSLGYNILICTVDRRVPMEPQIQHLNSLDAQGAILFATEMAEEDLDFFNTLRYPFVALDHCFPYRACHSVAINNQMGTYLAIEHLVQLGHTHIGYLKCKSRISSFDERETGYRDALAAFGLTLAPEDIWDISFTEESSYQDMRQMLAQGRKLPQAFVCDDDSSMVGAMRALSEAGVSIPKELSLVGYNDRPACQSTTPALTTINVPRRDLSFAAVDELDKLIQERTHRPEPIRSRKIRVGTRLVVRSSTTSPSNA